MRASVLTAPQTSEVQSLDAGQLGPQDVRLRVEACGVCASEMSRWTHGNREGFPQRMGHEPSGIVEAVGADVTTVQVGQKAAALMPQLGAFAESVVVPAKNIVPVADHVDFQHALGEPLGCLVSGLERTPIHVGDRVALIGCGFMGLALLQLVRWSGAREIIAIDVREAAREHALKLGADVAYHPNEVPASDQVIEFEQMGQGVEVVFETTGVQPALTLAGNMTREHGTLSIVGWHEDGVRQVDMGLWNWKALTVINAHERRMDTLVQYMAAGLRLIEAGKLDMAALVTHTYPLAEVDAAFTAMQEKPPGFIKAVILPQE